MKNQVLIFTLAFTVVGCLDENQPPRPGPADQGIEDNFDARRPPVAPNTGVGRYRWSAGIKVIFNALVSRAWSWRLIFVQTPHHGERQSKD